MQRFELIVGQYVQVVPEGTTEDQFLSIEGGNCRIYTGATVPTSPLSGHMVRDGYQVIVPSSVQVWARLEGGSDGAAVVSDFGQ